MLFLQMFNKVEAVVDALDFLDADVEDFFEKHCSFDATRSSTTDVEDVKLRLDAIDDLVFEIGESAVPLEALVHRSGLRPVYDAYRSSQNSTFP